MTQQITKTLTFVVNTQDVDGQNEAIAQAIGFSYLPLVGQFYNTVNQAATDSNVGYLAYLAELQFADMTSTDMANGWIDAQVETENLEKFDVVFSMGMWHWRRTFTSGFSRNSTTAYYTAAEAQEAAANVAPCFGGICTVTAEQAAEMDRRNRDRTAMRYETNSLYRDEVNEQRFGWMR